MQYAVLDENGVVTAILENEDSFSAFLPKSAVVIDNIWPKPSPGWKFCGNSFIPGNYEFIVKPKLHLTADKQAVIADNTDIVNIEAVIKDTSGNVIAATTTEYAVIKNYGAIEVNFVDGVANIPLKVPAEKSGKLTFTCQDATKYEVVTPLTIFAVLK